MNLAHISNNRRKWAKGLTCWIPIKIYRKALRGIICMGIGDYIRILRYDKHTQFAHELSITAIMKNEGPYLKEWLDYHILAGVEKFYLYDNASTDDTAKILAPYIKRGIVKYTYFPGRAMQNRAYLDALDRFAYDTRWMAIIDLDEFIVPVQHSSIVDFLHTLPRNFGALVMSWVIYGSSGHKTKPDGLVIENYKYHANRTRPSGCKSIVNPRLVVRMSNPHVNEVAGFLIDENGKKLGRINQTDNPPPANKIRCNHYITKSYQEYKARCQRGSAGAIQMTEWKRWSDEKFKKWDNNDIFDHIMDSWIEKVKNFTL